MPVKNNSSGQYGTGLSINFPFKHRNKYRIEFIYLAEASNVGGNFQSLFPKLKAKLDTSPTVQPPTDLCTDAKSRDLTGDMARTVPESKNYSGVTSIEYIADQCYGFLNLSAIPNLEADTEGSILIKTIKIIEIPQLVINGPMELPTNTQSSFSVSTNNFPIGADFTWTVTGDLQIIYK